jgi:glycine/D-amino acid oxidase-like deaminating enzyme
MNQGYDYFRFVDGRLLIGGGRNRFPAETGTSELRPTVHVRQWLEQQAELVIGHRDWTTEHHWAGMMGFVGGQHLGGSPRRRLDEHTEIIAGFGGMGVALAPLYAKDIVNEMP